jgi:two-component system, NarL family, invasion response regulator UvrY
VAIQVYLCDDVPALRLVLRTVLELDGDVVVVGESGDGRTALEDIARLRPDVLVLDLSLPELDGLEVLDELAARSPQTRVIVFSGYPEGQLGAAARSRGALRYVEKGTDIELVARYVREVALEAA